MERHERILDAAIAVFAKDGFAIASTNTIAKHAQSSKGLLFHHFQNKEGLYYAAYRYCCAHHLAFLQERFAQIQDPKQRFLAWILAMHEYASRYPFYALLLDQSLLTLPPGLQTALQADQLGHHAQQAGWLHQLVQSLPLRKENHTEDVVDYLSLIMATLQADVLHQVHLDELMQKGERYYEWVLHGVT